MFNTNIYQSAAGAGGAIALTDIPVSPGDQSTTIVNGHPIYPVPIQLIMGHVLFSANPLRAQFSTPKLRAVSIHNLRPIDVGAEPTTRTPMVEQFHTR